MGNLKSFFIEKDDTTITESLESLLDDGEVVEGVLRGDLINFLPTLEALVDYGESIDRGDAGAVSNYLHLTESVLRRNEINISCEDIDGILEGLFKVIGSVGRKIVSGARVIGIGGGSDRQVRSIRKIESIIRNKYLNDAWVDKQDFITGEVVLGKYSNLITSNEPLSGGTVALHYVERMQELMTAMRSWDDAVKEYVDEIDRIDAGIENVARTLFDDVTELAMVINFSVAELSKLPLPGRTSGLAGKKFQLANGQYLTFHDKGFTIQRNEGRSIVPALESDDISLVGEAMKVSLDIYTGASNFANYAGNVGHSSPHLTTRATRSLEVASVAERWWKVASEGALIKAGMLQHRDFMTSQLLVTKAFNDWVQKSIK